MNPADLEQRLWHMRAGEHEGPAAMLAGHGLSEDEVRDKAAPILGVGELETIEVHMHYTPRVMWCSRIDGFGCEAEGDWHGHWHETLPNPHHPEAGAWTAVFVSDQPSASAAGA